MSIIYNTVEEAQQTADDNLVVSDPSCERTALHKLCLRLSNPRFEGLIPCNNYHCILLVQFNTQKWQPFYLNVSEVSHCKQRNGGSFLSLSLSLSPLELHGTWSPSHLSHDLTPDHCGPHTYTGTVKISHNYVCRGLAISGGGELGTLVQVTVSWLF